MRRPSYQTTRTEGRFVCVAGRRNASIHQHGNRPMTESKLRILLPSMILIVFLGGIAVSQNASDPVSAKLGIQWILVEGGEMGDFYIAATEVTFDQFDAFCDATGRSKPEETYGRGKQPVVNVNVQDAQDFCAWLSKQTGSTVRMPTSEEWVYAAEGGNKSERPSL